MHSADDWKQQERARCERAVARVTEPECRPGGGLVVGDCGLARGLGDRKMDAWGLGAEQEGGGGRSAGWKLPARWPCRYDLMVVQGEDAPCPAALPAGQVLFPAGEPEAPSVLPAWAGALEAAGLRRDFGWKSWGALGGAALFRPAREGQDASLVDD